MENRLNSREEPDMERRSPLEQQIGACLRANRPLEHLAPEDFLELAQKGNRVKGYRQKMEHLMSCSECQRTYLSAKEVEVLAKNLPHAKRRYMNLALLSLGGAAIAGLVVLAVWWSLERNQAGTQVASEPSSSVSQPTPPSPTPPAEPAPTPQTEPARPEPKPKSEPQKSEPSKPPVPKRIIIAQNLYQEGHRFYEGRTQLPTWANELVLDYQSSPTVRSSGSGRPVPIRLESPPLMSNRALEETNPVFSWQALEGASQYTVTLIDEETGDTLSELSVSDRRVQFPQPLKRGQEYRLTLKARVDWEGTGILNTVSASYRFRVLTPEEIEHLQWAWQNADSAPLTSAIVLYKLGFYDEASRLLAQHAKDPKVKRWYEYISAQAQTGAYIGE